MLLPERKGTAQKLKKKKPSFGFLRKRERGAARGGGERELTAQINPAAIGSYKNPLGFCYI